MSEFRIKITENWGGEFWFTPQVKVKGNFITRLKGGKWLNITKSGIGSFDESDTLTMSWSKESEAHSIIEDYKLFKLGKSNKQPKSITYKPV